MQTDLFDYPLPEELIARVPAARRDRSRLMVIDRSSGSVTHTEFAQLPQFLPQGARLFRNNATVLRARLRAQRPSGGQVECLLLRPAREEDITLATAAVPGHTPPPLSAWDFICLLKPGKRLKPGETFGREGHFSAQVLDKHPDGENRVRFTPLRGQQSVVQIAALAGELPLPPYIEQARVNDRNRANVTAADTADSAVQTDVSVAGAATPSADDDAERYQTVYADPSRTVAAAAPTAGLHFTPELLATLAQQGIPAHDLTLHVGLDTFRPISAERVEEHRIHRELYEIPAATLAALEPQAQRPRVAVGTTSLRSIEHYFAHRPANALPQQDWIAEADIFIYPPARFAGAEALITNFHLPRSTLLCLVSAFLSPGNTDGIAHLKELYSEAISRRYRFFSYGDAMLIV